MIEYPVKSEKGVLMDIDRLMSILIYNRRKLPLLKFRTLGLLDLPNEIIFNYCRTSQLSRLQKLYMRMQALFQI